MYDCLSVRKATLRTDNLAMNLFSLYRVQSFEQNIVCEDYSLKQRKTVLQALIHSVHTVHFLFQITKWRQCLHEI